MSYTPPKATSTTDVPYAHVADGTACDGAMLPWNRSWAGSGPSTDVLLCRDHGDPIRLA
jgi:hypothetical protein